MIVSHKHRFIFVKTAKTAGTSVETLLSKACGPDDILTPFVVREDGHEPRNYRGMFNPIPDIVESLRFNVRLEYMKLLKSSISHKSRNFFHHMPAWRIKNRLPEEFESYFKFAVVRNPYDVVLSGLRWRAERNRQLNIDNYLHDLKKIKARRTNGVGQVPFNQYIYCHPKTNEILVDRILRFEELVEQLQIVFDDLGVPLDATDIGRAKGVYTKRASIKLSAAQLDTVADIFSWELEQFSYSPPAWARQILETR
ncbi:MAG: sulfotransferase family 2 domain-containing protein [Rhodobacteraceae bacterium]|nr:sulfotransferase family 2 domain-containing protein [Paracoccaceae bacterium]